MTQLGTFNQLQIIRTADQGVYLDGGELGDILLPRRHVPAQAKPGDTLDVFLYNDSDNRIIATTEQPKAVVGQCAYLELLAVNKVGAFFDWGLPKDLLVPYAEQGFRMNVGHFYIVYLYQNKASGRLVGSTKLSKYLNEYSDNYKPKQAVELLICGRSELGYKAVINNSHLGLIHHSDVYKPVKLGQRLRGYIKAIREDGKINLCLTLANKQQLGELAEKVLQDLKDNGGQSNLTDSSPPKAIYDRWHVSKGSYKKALGALYKQRLIQISPQQISLVETDD
ncbi:S1 RNA-binding domain-containing protein [Marinicella sp. W31]|uniref:CvfB family protein n=1 Tax=Marinicella sp. W31 TaxID=3023713 RepID=UPI003756BBC8